MLTIQKTDVITVYPHKKRMYFGRKWAVVSYELSNGQRGILDFPIPADCDDINPAAHAAIMASIKRGTFGDILPIPQAA